MADNITIGIPSGSAVVSTDEIGGVHHQRLKVQYGDDGTAVDVSSTNPLPTYASRDKGPVLQNISRLLDTNGDGTGTTSAVGDYSSGVEDFYIEPTGSPEQIIRIESLQVFIRDAGSFNADRYGVDLTLSNGIQVLIEDGSGTIHDFTAHGAIIDTVDWLKLPKTSLSRVNWVSGDEVVRIQMIFFHPVRLQTGEKFIVRLNDNFTSLVDHSFAVEAFSELELT